MGELGDGDGEDEDAGDTREAAADHRERGRCKRRHHARLEVPHPGSAGDHEDVDRRHPAPEVVGDAELEDGAAEDGGHHVGRARHAETGEREQQRRSREPERRDREAPHPHRDQHRETLPFDPPDPTGRDRADDGAERHRGEQDPHEAGAAVEPFGGDGREQRPRHAEHHCDQVDDERGLEHAPPTQVAEPFDDAAAFDVAFVLV
ncbi:MAG: hypothetical protein U0V73_14345 [Acidimicrobiia bacterium]